MRDASALWDELLHPPKAKMGIFGKFVHLGEAEG
jgi:hypothetical protein